MNEKVQEFLNRKKDEERRKYEEYKAKTLDELGIYERIYGETDGWSKEFPEWDVDQNKYFKKVPIDVTDEEFDAIQKHIEEKVGYEGEKENSIAIALTIIAWLIYIGGFISGFILGTVEVAHGYYYTYTSTEFSFASAFVYWCASLISGTMFLGFAEIIKLLEKIKNKK